MSLLSEVLTRADEFDVIHFHTDMIHFPFFARCADKTITTLHGRLDMKDIGGVYERWPGFGLVSISDDQRRGLPMANWAATVHHGLPTRLYAFSPRPRGYLAFLGRISPEKRPDRAIEIARYALARFYASVFPVDMRLFFYMPFGHSEHLADQQLACALFETIGGENNIKSALDHRDVVARFGRFPHRNEVLGRSTTAEELEYLKNANRYGQ